MDQKVKRGNDHLPALLVDPAVYPALPSTDNISCTISDLGARVGSKWEPASVTSSHFLSHERCPALQTIVGTEALLVSAWRSLESLDKTKIQVGLVSFP